MNQTTIIMLNMRGSCATEGKRVHALFRVNNRLSSAKTIKNPHAPSMADHSETVSLAEPARDVG
jgi:hypothetical protein